MEKQTWREIVGTVILLLVHILVSVFFLYCNYKIYIGFLGDLGQRVLIHWLFYSIIVVVCRLIKKVAGAEELTLKTKPDLRHPIWVAILKRLCFVSIIGMILIMYILCVIYVFRDGVVKNPYLFGNYIPIVYMLLFPILAFKSFKTDVGNKMGYKHEGYSIFCFWSVLIDGICICIFFVVVLAVRPVSYRQASQTAQEAGLVAPEFIEHGETGNLSSYFGDIDYFRLAWSIYEKNEIRMTSAELQKNEGKLGYYFFAGEKDGEAWGIAVSEITGRIVKQIEIENPIRDEETY